jgi:hypothetical protein
MLSDFVVVADRHIVECQKRIADQIRRIREMECRGDDTMSSCELLATMRQSLALHKSHRENIIDCVKKRALRFPGLEVGQERVSLES